MQLIFEVTTTPSNAPDLFHTYSPILILLASPYYKGDIAEVERKIKESSVGSRWKITFEEITVNNAWLEGLREGDTVDIFHYTPTNQGPQVGKRYGSGTVIGTSDTQIQVKSGKEILYFSVSDGKLVLHKNEPVRNLILN